MYNKPSDGVLLSLSQTMSQLCVFDYVTKDVQVQRAPWLINDKPRFKYRGLLLGKISIILTVTSLMSFLLDKLGQYQMAMNLRASYALPSTDEFILWQIPQGTICLLKLSSKLLNPCHMLNL